MDQRLTRPIPPHFNPYARLSIPPAADIFMARKYHAHGSHRHRWAKASLRAGDLEEAAFRERMAIECFLRSMHALDCGGGNLGLELSRIWCALTEAGLEPSSELLVADFADIEPTAPLDQLFAHGDRFEVDSAVRLAVADPAHAFMPEKI